MKIVLICPSNMLYMPYVKNYEPLLKERDIDYNIINWDRFGIEEISEFSYRDNKVGHQRNFFDYYKYKKFIIKHLNSVKYDKIIVFGIQLSFFLKEILQKKFIGNYIIDIRDYNKILKIFNPIKTIETSSFVTISSPAYKEWLPISDKYIVNHNTNIRSIDRLIEPKIYNKKEISISYIGALANFQENRDFINSLKGSSKFLLKFHGQGTINNKLEEYIKEYNIGNVEIYDRYEKSEESELYIQADLINMILYNKNINDKTCLSNRLYNSALYGRPMVAISGTHISEVINMYNLGLVINSYDSMEQKLLNYLSRINIDEYNKGRIIFLNKVLKENMTFIEKFTDFLIN
ncbi:hypothetical protein RBU61_15520 [Tissierella sp. MB52-C2]|uniref:hypothetical protein n=1 Tax=Tissierella sp. MB52-C2 TaxID=3070999 RepID=UPI00280BF702|nr:hypothetical protein [Tissierella sp. MB52-C2]WMM24323.1 hypothetical protein RBU61_15520 [Tissierella sp. MB52-C2]